MEKTYTTLSIDRVTAEKLRRLCYKLKKTRADLIREWVADEENYYNMNTTLESIDTPILTK